MKKKDDRNEEEFSLLTIPEIDKILNSYKYSESEHLQLHSPSTISKVDVNEINNKIDIATHQMEDMISFVSKGGDVPITEIKEEIIPTIKKATEIPYLFYLFYDLNRKDDYTYKHMVSVGIIATIIGKWLKIPQDLLDKLTLAATVHDIGKSRIPREILNKPGKLTKEEYEEMKLHTVFGYHLLKKIPELDLRIPLVALQHHEREDGTGYPLGLMGNNISQFSKIVAIADVFHAMSSSRVYHHAKPLYEVIKQMQDDVFGVFDPNIMLIFIYKMMEKLIGHTVQLSDDSIGTIVMIHPSEPLRSLISIENGLVDLRFRRDLQIVKVLDDHIVNN